MKWAYSLPSFNEQRQYFFGTSPTHSCLIIRSYICAYNGQYDGTLVSDG